MADREPEKFVEFPASDQTRIACGLLSLVLLRTLDATRELLGPSRTADFDKLCDGVINCAKGALVEGLGLDQEANALRIAVLCTEQAVNLARSEETE